MQDHIMVFVKVFPVSGHVVKSCPQCKHAMTPFGYLTNGAMTPPGARFLLHTMHDVFCSSDMGMRC
eukprot:m.8360 g.8360  ORF g.8360 m.8360 type:complete len:66 (-) comp3100_c0_seq1:2692-2889(-)